MSADNVKFDSNGLVPVIAQSESGSVLMMAWMNRQTLEQTMKTGLLTLWSRSRSEVWVKGGTSGNIQRVIKIQRDCDGDALLATVREAGPACHTGAVSCFDAETIFKGAE